MGIDLGSVSKACMNIMIGFTAAIYNAEIMLVTQHIASTNVI